MVPNTTMGSFSVFMLLLGIKFIVKPVMTTKETMAQSDTVGGLRDIGIICRSAQAAE